MHRQLSDDGLLREPEDVLVVSARNAYPEYHRLHAYICQADRFRRAVARIGFYTAKQIQPEFPLVLHTVQSIEFSEDSAEQLAQSRNPRDAEVARVIRGRLASGIYPDGVINQVFILSPPEDSRTIRLSSPIQHLGRGAWTQSHRWLRSSILEKGPTTTEDLASGE